MRKLHVLPASAARIRPTGYSFRNALFCNRKLKRLLFLLIAFLVACPVTFAYNSDPYKLAPGKQLVILTPDVADGESLIRELDAGKEVYQLTSEKSVIQQLTDLLRTHQGIEAVHLISHGNPGSLRLGNEKLDATNLTEYTETLRQWGRSLAPGGSFLLYGCEVAKGRAGTAFITKLADLLQAPVAASDNLTGAAHLGGNWILERHIGNVNASALTITGYNGLLQTPPDGAYTFANAVNNNNGTFTTADGFFLISGVNGTGGTLTINADAFGIFMGDPSTTTSGTSYLEVHVKNGGSFKVTNSAIGDYDYLNTTTPALHNDFYNVYAVGYAGGVEVARTPMHTSTGIYETDYHLDFSAFTGRPIDAFRVYYSWNTGTSQDYFNLLNLSISNASVIPPPTISTSATGPTAFCAGNTVAVPFTVTGSFASGNIFTAQLSNAAGSFASPVNIGTLSSTASGTINATIPAATTDGTSYRIRVISSNPVVTGTDNGNNLRITKITISGSLTNVSCNGGNNGSITASPSGGTAPYTYSWSSSGGTGATTTGRPVGTYTVTVTDANGCSAPQSFTITQPSALTASNSHTNVSCFGGFNGTATVVASGGTGPYTYSWAPSGGTAATATGLAAGTYTCTITDNNACQITSNVTISQPTAALTTTSITQTSVSCFGGSNATATVVASGGTPNYTYSWAPTGGNAATASGLVTGTYTVTITDANSCQITRTVTIAQPSALSASISAQTNVACISTSTGSASVSVTGGTTPYTYSWAPNGGSAATATGLAAGTYTVTVTDNKGCSDASSVTITQPVAPTINPTYSNVSCNGGSNGSASFAISGGVGPYTYSWAPSGGTAPTASGLSTGAYTCTATDANGCIFTGNFNLTQPTAFSITTSQTDVSCNGGSNGTASVNVSGATAPYTYAWAPSGGLGATAAGLQAGAYTCTITDANGCQTTRNFTITQPTALNATTSQNNILCNGSSTGTATVTPSGGVGPYTYSWSPSGGTGATASGLSAGTYTCTITDANGCFITRNFTITQPPVLTAIISSQTNIACNGGSTGSVTVSASGGTGSYTYSWAPSGGTGATASGLVAGTYTVTITDANGCFVTSSATITQPTALTVSPTQTNVSCNGGSNGTASVSVSGGTPGYTYSWAPSGGTAAITTGRLAGTYTVTVTDANGCNFPQSFTIIQPAAFSATTSKTDVSCNGGTNGIASIVASGATAPYTYVWAPSGGTAATATGLAAGTYTVTVTDANGCMYQRTININQPTALTATTSQTNILCNGSSTGTVTVTPSGGTAPYTYSWAPSGGTSATASGLSVGTYSCTITDNNGCFITRNFTITQPPVLTATTSQTDVSCNGGNNGQAAVVASGGTGPYTYLWSNGGTAATTNGLTAGNHSCLITDANGCMITKNFTITQPVAVTVTSINIPATGTYKVGDNLTFTINYNQPVTVNVVGGSPYINIDLNGGITRLANYNGGSGTNSLTFAYTVDVTDQDPDGIGLGNSIVLNGATLQNGIGCTAITSLTGIPSLAGVKIHNQVPQTITFTAIPNKTYGDADFDPGATTSSGLTVSYVSSNTGVATIVAGQIHIVGAGSTTITASQPGDVDYFAAGDVQQTLTISPKALAVNANAQTKVYGDADPSLTYNVTGLVGSDAMSGALTRAAGNNVGTYAITQGNLTAGNNYTITYTGADLTITPKAVVITAASQTKTYGDADPTLTYSVAPALVSGDVFSGALSRVAGENVGAYAIQQNTLTLSANYALTYTGAQFTITKKAITVSAEPKNKTYGDTDPALTYTVAPALVSGDTFTGALARAVGENVGTYAIQQNTLALSGNYDLTYTGANLTINLKTVTVAAEPKTKTYGDADPALTYTVTPALVSGDAFTGTLDRVVGEDVGNYTIQQNTLALNSNYILNYTLANLTIVKKGLTITADAQTKIYGETDPALTYTVTGLVGSDALTGSLTRVVGENVGTYAIQQGSLAASTNYTITYNGADLSITPRAVTVTAQAKHKIYGEVDPALTYTTSPALLGSDVFSGALSRVAGENAGTYAIQQGSLNNTNYAITYIGALLTIEKAAQQITWSQTLITGCDGITRITLTATASSGLPVSYTSADATIAVINGNEVIMKGAGTVTITASQPGNNNYLPATAVTNTLIAKLPAYMVVKRWSDVLVFDNSSNQYDTWQWYKNGTAISGANGQYYYENGNLNGTYYAVVKTKEDVAQQTCPVSITAGTTVIPIAIFPNPIAPGQAIIVKSGYSATELQGASIIVSNVLGVIVQTVQNVTPQTSVTMPLAQGIYIIKLRLANGVTASVNALVKPL